MINNKKGAFDFNHYILREQLIEKLNKKEELSDSELKTIAKDFPMIMVNCMVPNGRVAAAYVKECNPLNRQTFPDSVWDDKEALYQVFCNKRHLVSAAWEKLDSSIIERYIKEHTDAEIISFFNERPYYLNNKKLMNKALIGLINSSQKNAYGLESSSDTICDNPIQELNKVEPYKDIDLSGEITLVKEHVTSKKAIISNTQKNDDIICPREFHYITDLHLTHKVKAKVENGIPVEKAIRQVVKKAVRDIKNSLIQSKEEKGFHFMHEILLIGGDVSFNYEIYKEFFNELVSYSSIDRRDIYVVLGNHELWDSDPSGRFDHDYNSVVLKYKELLKTLGITLLENQVVAVLEDTFLYEKYLIEEDELLKEENQSYLESLFSKSRYIICGGIGFSGCNDSFNYGNGIYRNTIKSREEEIERSRSFETFYNTLRRLAKDRSVICLTHMPITDWTHNHGDINTIYVNGHTHNNHRSDDIIRDYNDNQIGYKKNKYSTKHFTVDTSYDLFFDYSDGIHKISRADYYEFGRGIGLNLCFRHDPDSSLFLLKKEGLYMFISANKNGLCILNGGSRKRLSSDDLNYYYANMTLYADMLRESFGEYDSYLKDISKVIKKIGGEGKVHGCIVDIDFYNHIYVNPFDGKVTYYFATNTTERLVFPDLSSMIESNYSGSDTIKRIQTNIADNKDQLSLQLGGQPRIQFTEELSIGTYIYRPSRLINKIQKLFNYNVLQYWDDYFPSSRLQDSNI